MTLIPIMMLYAAGIYSTPSGPTTMVHPPFGHCMGIYRAGTEQLAMLLGGLVRFDDPQGLACVKLEAWDDADRTADDDELAVYGVNSGSGHVIYNADMYTLGLYGGNGSDEDELLSPHGIAADPTGLVVVADTGNDRVVVLRRSGTRLVPDGLLPWEFDEPWGVALEDDGRVWVTDRAAGTLCVFDSLTDAEPAVMALERPTGVDAVLRDDWFHDDDSFAVAVIRDGGALVRIDGDSVTREVLPGDCGGAVFNYPVIDFYGNVWVTDSITCLVHKFDGELRHLDSFGGPGTGDTEFDRPTGIAVWRRFGQIFVAEREGARYFWVGTDIADPDLVVSGDTVTLDGVLTESSFLDAWIEDAGGGRIATVADGRFPAGDLALSWLRESGPRSASAPAGDYRMIVEIEPTYSSRGYFDKRWEIDFTLEEPAGSDPGTQTAPATGRGLV